MKRRCNGHLLQFKALPLSGTLSRVDGLTGSSRVFFMKCSLRSTFALSSGVLAFASCKAGGRPEALRRQSPENPAVLVGSSAVSSGPAGHIEACPLLPTA